jgi:hypothetical protein
MPLRCELRLARVHGVIFQSFRDYLVTEHGRVVAQTVFAAEREYLLSEAYPDAALIRLIGAAAAETAREVDEIVYGLGVFTAETTFARLYPAFFAQTPTPRAFLLTVEEHIHELIRATIPRAGPPRLRIAALGEDGVSIRYSSPRRLCVLLRGLTEGTARHYGQRAELDEPECMLRGDAACSFDVTFSAAATP